MGSRSLLLRPRTSSPAVVRTHEASNLSTGAIDNPIVGHFKALSPTSMANTMRKKSQFYFEHVILQAENTLHCIPRRYLEYHSQFFKDLFSLPQGPDPEGRSEDNPIVLSGCTNSEFEYLLGVIVPDLYRGLQVLVVKPLTKDTLAKERWTSVLKLASMWDMAQIKERAIQAIGTLCLSPIEMVELGRQFMLSAWYIDGCVALLMDKEKLPVPEVALNLGWETAARIAWAGCTLAVVPKPQETLIHNDQLMCSSCRIQPLRMEIKRGVCRCGSRQCRWEGVVAFDSTYHSSTQSIVCESCEVEVSSVRASLTLVSSTTQKGLLAARVREVFADELKDMK